MKTALSLLLLTGCMAPNARVATRVNAEARLTGEMPVDPFQWKVIAAGTAVDDSAMFTLFGNDIAIRYSRATAERDYPAGSKLALVTWNQQEDSRWFGGRIPASPQSVELVTVRASADGGRSSSYEVFEGSPLKKRVTSIEESNRRVADLLSRRATMMP